MPFSKKRKSSSSKKSYKPFKKAKKFQVDMITKAPSGATKAMYGQQGMAYHFRQITYNANNGVTRSPWITQSTIPTFGGLIFRAADLPNFAAFQTIFDQYRIDKIQIEYLPQQNAIGVTSALIGTPSTGTGSSYGRIIGVIDFDNAVAATSLDQLEQYNNAQEVPAYKNISFCWRPKVASAVFQPGVTTGYANITAPWIDCAYGTIEHYGSKWGMSAGIANLPCTYDIRATYFMSFKNTI